MADPLTPRPRANVLAIGTYVPGRPPAPRPGVSAFKLSSNENPYPPLPGVLAAASEAIGQMNRYPDMGVAALSDALAEFLGIGTDHLATATGSVGLIYQLIAAFCEPGDEVIYPWRSFEAYPIAVAAGAASGVRVPLTADARHDLDAMAAAVTERTKVLIVCTPNNPTGPAFTQNELDRLLAQVPTRVLVILDEAYVEFVRSPDPVDGVATVRRHPNVVSTRTFSKAYGLAGLRVGYAVAQPPLAAALRAVALPFGVSTVAQAAAVASLAAREALGERVATLVERRTRVLAGLRERGWQVPDAQGNFVWLPIVGDGASERTAAFCAAAEEVGLVVRPFVGDGIRVSIGEDEACERVLELPAPAAPPASPAHSTRSE